jgi:hypothetical protein
MIESEDFLSTIYWSSLKSRRVHVALDCLVHLFEFKNLSRTSRVWLCRVGQVISFPCQSKFEFSYSHAVSSLICLSKHLVTQLEGGS